MTGPSAIGSENGNPTSMTSAPAAGSSASRLAVVPRSGSPAVTNGRKALWPVARSRTNVASTGFMRVVYRPIIPASRRRPQLVLTDLFVLPALVAVWLCYRVRRLRVLVDILPLPTILIVGFAAYWVWFAHRPQPSSLTQELAPGVTYVRESRTI